jgi:hypothetical protein
VKVEPDQARQLLGALRIAFGAGSWIAPRLFTRLLGQRLDDNPAAALLWRVFGTRDIVIGLALLDGDEAEVRRWLTYGLAIDGADMVATLAAGLRGRLPKYAATYGTLAALLGVALGARARGDI